MFPFRGEKEKKRKRGERERERRDTERGEEEKEKEVGGFSFQTDRIQPALYAGLMRASVRSSRGRARLVWMLTHLCTVCKVKHLVKSGPSLS